MIKPLSLNFRSSDGLETRGRAALQPMGPAIDGGGGPKFGLRIRPVLLPAKYMKSLVVVFPNARARRRQRALIICVRLDR